MTCPTTSAPDNVSNFAVPNEILPCPSPPVDKKLKVDSATKRKNMSWTKAMETKLLELRLSTHKDCFIDSKKKQDASAGWSKVTDEFNEHCKFATPVPVDKLKNKFNSLKSDFRGLKEAQSKTGNDGTIEYPENWETVLSLFGNRPGLAAQNLGESHTMLEDSEVGENDAEVNGNPSKSTSMKHANFNSATPTPVAKKRKVDLAVAVMNMGEAMKHGMLALAGRGGKQETSDEDLNIRKTTLAAVTSLQESVDKMQDINKQLLEFLKQQ